MICSGTISEEVIRSIYESPNTKLKSQLVEMVSNETNTRCGSCRVKFSYNNTKRKTYGKGAQIAKVFKDFSFDASDRIILE